MAVSESRLSLLGSIRPFGVLVPGLWGHRGRLAGPEYAECVSSGLQSRLLMQETQLEKMVAMLRQEKRKLLEDWDLLRPHLEDWKVICKDKEEDTSDLKSQQQQVGAGKEVRLRPTTICPFDCLSAHSDTNVFTHYLILPCSD